MYNQILDESESLSGFCTFMKSLHHQFGVSDADESLDMAKTSSSAFPFILLVDQASISLSIQITNFGRYQCKAG